MYPHIGPSHPISEIMTSHVYRLKKKTRNEGDQKMCFVVKRVRIQRHILSVKWLSGCSEVGDHEIYQK